MVVRDEGPHDGLAGFVVVPDRGGQCKDPRQDAGEDALVGAAAVSFKVKLAFEGLVDGLDDLAQRLEQVLAGAWGLALAQGSQQDQVTRGEFCLEVRDPLV